jgi:hypothetical protein
MNSFLPRHINQNLADPAPNEVANTLQRRLAQETQGQVLFSLADRGRYATDASIYQQTRWACSAPARRRT